MEDSKKGRKPNSTDKQKNMLVDFIVFHPELVSGKNTIKSTVKHRQKLWENIANMLNSDRVARYKIRKYGTKIRIFLL